METTVSILPSAKLFKETLIKYVYRHAGDRFVWNESGRTQYVLRVQTMDGLQPNQHPVNDVPPSYLPPRRGKGIPAFQTV